MGIKSDKTFEEIVERIIALFKPEPEALQVPQPSEAPQPFDPDPSDPPAATSSDETDA